MLEWIIILIVVAAIAAFLGLGRLSGAALSGAKILVVLALALALLSLLGVFAASA
ncbi:DUF1328 family protein [Jannaschia marina]|uniref:DUF1328 family protein n=1 Tax=Jannaschia marina TaxID=2741674 RepID=UPI0015C7169F|nr:DUF1328 family protein [Jannaschia marina]